MNNWKLMASSLFIACASLAQQMDVRLVLSHSVFIVGEPVVVEMSFANNTREPFNTLIFF